jgi:glucosamine--fructose-6-phosphate aminotransferase (isomerizing)
MCGIVGLVNGHAVAKDLVKAIGRLEYRGYDSVGLAVGGPGFAVRKVAGRGETLMEALRAPGAAAELSGHAGIAHTRWATHGRAEVRNAHPHVFAGVAVVHNGIIENHQELRDELMGEGHEFASDTDSEVIPHLIAMARAAGAAPAEAVRQACGRLHGAYAVAVMIEDAPDRVLVARQGSPVVVARADGAAAVASDPAALAGFMTDYAALEDGDLAELTHAGVRILDQAGNPAQRSWLPLGEEAAADTADQVALARFSTHARREIAEQRAALTRTDVILRDRSVPAAIAAASRLVLVGCGSSLYAAQTARSWIEKLSGIPCDIEVASEFRYREAPLAAGTVAVLISQSGETADTLAVLEMMRARDFPVVAVVNVAHSQMARGADLLWPTGAGREQSVAATKSFTAQVFALVRLGLAIGRARGTLDIATAVATERGLAEAPTACALTEGAERRFAAIAARIASENEALFIGRGWAAAIAGEGALKLKELSYIGAAAYPAGELKHGPLAVIRERSPVIVCAADDALVAKTIANAEEVRARGGHVIALVEQGAASRFEHAADEVVALPGRGLAAVFAAAVAVQLIALHTALILGHDVDRPRNLAKSVTVE